MWTLLRRLFGKLSARRRTQFALLMLLMLLAAIAEVITLGAVLPFLAILTAPEKVLANPWVAGVAAHFGLTSPEQLALPITVAFAAVAVTSGVIRLLSLWANTRLAYDTGADLGVEIYRRTLYQPYLVHTARNSAEVLSGVTRNVDAVVVGVLMPSLILAGSGLLVIAIAVTLLAIDPLVATGVIVGFGAFYVIVNFICRKQVQRNSQRIAKEQVQVFKALQEGLSGIRDVILDGTEEHYARLYRQADLPLRRAQGRNVFVAQSPRFILEAIAIAMVAFLAYALSGQANGLAGALPMLGVLALGGQRMLPALQQMYAAWSSMMGARAVLASTVQLLDQPLPASALGPPPEPLKFEREIRFDDVRFRYDSAHPWVLEGVDIVIPKGARVGLAGPTGSGKSTAMDVLMGLLPPTEGALRVDGVAVDSENTRAWRRHIAHVPQEIYLADASFAENIALGEPHETIDLERVKRAAAQARIDTFIEGSPEGYDGRVGERGVRLSGGQRQRLGIARALYKQASVLVLDEATSALDNATEQLVMEAVKALDRKLTVLIIAHRLTTLRHCDMIIELDKGKIVGRGTYEELVQSSPGFRHMRAP
jgi:ABC-type multidrug transport system fused ATPase/permease subunit